MLHLNIICKIFNLRIFKSYFDAKMLILLVMYYIKITFRGSISTFSKNYLHISNK